ncbi:MAG TPA: DUF1080 domain-containing protein [Tepidisphaeraceae bacterium]|nr:DUF1080 domain-containing protein [Tepidisphaeraceae bacterium]
MLRLTASLSLSIVCCVAALSFAADDKKPAAAAAGATELYNGKDLTGWGYKAGPKFAGEVTEKFDGKTESSDGRYTAKEGGIIVVNPAKEGEPRIKQLWTTAQFPKDFELRLEFRAGVNADSGIFVRGPQLQCRDYKVAGPEKYFKLMGDKYKAQDWNEMVVVVKGDVGHATCNGVVLEEAMKLPATGGIGLEADRGTMEYRNIRVKELN